MYTDPFFRGKGIGRQLYTTVLDTEVAKRAAKWFTTYRKTDAHTVEFFTRRGVEPWIDVKFMHFHGEALPEPEIGWRLYEDGDFDEYVERYSDGFYELRKSIGEKPYAVKEKKCEEWRQQNLANRKNLYVFFKPGQDMTPSNLIGSALIRPDGWLDDLFVIPSLHGQGYGRKITQCMVNRCLERGLSPVSLDVVSTNTSAVQLYERLGFVVEQENTSGYGRIRK